MAAAAVSPSKKEVTNKCWNPSCGAVLKVALKCEKCFEAIYCGMFCLRADWSQHRQKCLSLKPKHSAATIAAAPKSTSPAATDSKRKDSEDINPVSILSLITEVNSSNALLEARRVAKLGKMSEAAFCVSRMSRSHQDQFFKEMSGIPDWVCVEVAIILAQAKRTDEASVIMKNLPSQLDVFSKAVAMSASADSSADKG